MKAGARTRATSNARLVIATRVSDETHESGGERERETWTDRGRIGE